MDFKIVLICILVVMLVVFLAGCVGKPAENSTEKKTTPENESATFNASLGRDVFKKTTDQIYGPLGYEYIFGTNQNWKAGDLPYHVYKYDLKDKKTGTTKTFTVWIVEDYTVIKASEDGFCYYSKVDYLYDYQDWIEGKTSTKPDIDNYPNYAAAVNGNKTYSEIDKEFYGN